MIRHINVMDGFVCKNRRGVIMMQDLGNRQFFKVEIDAETSVKKVLATVYEALVEKGYNPVNQIVGYVMSGEIGRASCRERV